MRRLVFGMMILLTTPGCSQVNVEVTDSDNTPPHEKIFRDEMEGRSADYVPPRVLELPPITYPDGAAEPGTEGIVMVRVLVGHDGKVLEAEIAQGLNQLVDRAALETARRGRYAPATESEIATDGWVTVPFRYPPPAEEAE
jgi:TonB family protein